MRNQEDLLSDYPWLFKLWSKQDNIQFDPNIGEVITLKLTNPDQFAEKIRQICLSFTNKQKFFGLKLVNHNGELIGISINESDEFSTTGNCNIIFLGTQNKDCCLKNFWHDEVYYIIAYFHESIHIRKVIIYEIQYPDNLYQWQSFKKLKKQFNWLANIYQTKSIIRYRTIKKQTLPVRGKIVELKIKQEQDLLLKTIDKIREKYMTVIMIYLDFSGQILAIVNKGLLNFKKFEAAIIDKQSDWYKKTSFILVEHLNTQTREIEVIVHKIMK